MFYIFFFSSRRRHTSCALVTGVQTCALPISDVDGIAYGQLDLWAYDHYHASVAGTYLSALVTFGSVTGIDPTKLGPREKGADELGQIGRASCRERVCPYV